MNREELEFLLKMRDEASRVLKQHEATVKQAASAVEELNQAYGGSSQRSRHMGAAAAAGAQQVKAATGATNDNAAASNKASDAVQKLRKDFTSMGAAVAVLHGPLGGIASRITSLGTIISSTNIAFAAAAIGVAGLAFGLSHAIRAAVQFETTMLGIEHILTKVGTQSGQTSESINKLAVDMARGTLASTAQVRNAARELLLYENVAEDTFETVLRLSQDLAAAGFGNLQMNATALARALEDPIQGMQALRRLGVQMGPMEQKLIRDLTQQGRFAEAQAMILERVDRRAGGAGEAEAKGAAGAWDTLTVNVGLFYERIIQTNGILAVLRGTLGAIGSGIGYLADNIEIVNAALAGMATYMALGAITRFGPALLAIGAAAARASVGILLMNAALLANPLTLIATLIAGAVAALVYFKDTTVTVGNETATVGDIVAATWNNIVAYIGAAWDTIKSVFTQIAEWASTTFGPYLPAIEQVGEWLKWLANVALASMMTMAEVAGRAAKAFLAAWNQAIDNLVERFEGLKGLFSSVIAGDLEGAMNNVGRIVRGTGVSALGAVRREFEGLGDSIKENFTTDHLGNWYEAGKELVQDLSTGIMEEAGKSFTERMRKAGEAGARALGAGVASGRQYLERALDDLMKKIDPTIKRLEEFTEAHNILSGAFREGLITMEQYTRAMQRVEVLYGTYGDAISSSMRSNEEYIRVLQTEQRARDTMRGIIALENAVIQENIDLTDAATMARYRQAIALIKQREAMKIEDNFRKRLEDMKDEIDLMRIGGAHREADVQAQRMLNELRREGVTVTTEMAEAVREYHRAMAEANDLGSVGLQAYLDSLDTFEVELGKLTQSAAEKFADALVDALASRNPAEAFRKMGLAIGRQMIQFFVNQSMRKLLEGMNLGNAAKDAALDRAQSAQDSLSKMLEGGLTTNQAIVNAATVFVNGTEGIPGIGQVAAPRTGGTPTGSVYRQGAETMQQAGIGNVGGRTTTPVVRELRGSLDAATQSAQTFSGELRGTIDNTTKSLNTFSGELRGTIDATTQQLDTFSGGLRGTIDTTTQTTQQAAQAIERAVPQAGGGLAALTPNGLHGGDLSRIQQIQRMDGIHPDLRAVVENATKHLPDNMQFQIAHEGGLRTEAQQRAIVNRGASRTMNSYHRTGKAVDINPVVDGQNIFNQANHPGWDQFAEAMRKSAEELNVPLEWGGDWKSFVDKPHWQLPRDYEGNRTAGMEALQYQQQATPPIPEMNPRRVEQMFETQLQQAMPTPTNNQDWLNQVYARGRGMGLNDTQSRLMASQAALESGWGKSAPGNNMFGIKAGENWTGDTQKLMTWEEINGQRVNMEQTFRKYGTLEEGMADRVKFMESNFSKAHNAETFEDAVQKLNEGRLGQYATDSGYAGKLHNINQQIDPNAYAPQIDSMTTGGIEQAQQALEQLGQTAQQSGQQLQQVQQTQQQAVQQEQMLAQQEAAAKQQLQAANQNNIMQTQMAGQQLQQSGQLAMQAGPQFQQAGQQIQQAGQQAAQGAQQAQMATPQLGGFGQGIQGLMGPLSQAIPGLGQFGGAVMQLIQQLMSMPMGGGLGGIFGLFHKGGEVGAGHPASGYRMAAPSGRLPRFHSGLKNDEFAAILQRGERVLTRDQNSDAKKVVEGLTDALESRRSQRGDGSVRGQQNSFNQNINVYANDASSFKKSEGQLMTDSSLKMRRMAGRNT